MYILYYSTKQKQIGKRENEREHCSYSAQTETAQTTKEKEKMTSDSRDVGVHSGWIK
jgi:hypothetical protein